jgi:hypothetical protein
MALYINEDFNVGFHHVPAAICQEDLRNGRFVTLVGGYLPGLNVRQILPFADYAAGEVVYHSSEDLLMASDRIMGRNETYFFVPAGEAARCRWVPNGGFVVSTTADGVQGNVQLGAILLPVTASTGRDGHDWTVAANKPAAGRHYGRVVNITENGITGPMITIAIQTSQG